MSRPEFSEVLNEIADYEAQVKRERIFKMGMEAGIEAGLHQAAEICRKYAHSGQNVYSRQVAYACERRIREALDDHLKQPKTHAV